MIDVINSLMPIVLLVTLIIASIFDVFKKQTIPLSIGFTSLFIRGLHMMIFDRGSMKECFYCALSLFCLFMIGAILGSFGGADSIYVSLCGFYLGLNGVYSVLLACFLSFPYAVLLKKRHKDGKIESAEFPFIPYLMLGVTVIIAERLM